MSLKVVITGATGLLGRALHHEFEALPDPQAAPPWWVVQPWGFSRADGERVLKVDLTSFPAVTKALEAFQPDILVHAAAERHPDVIEANPDAAHNLNVGATEHLAKECTRLGTKMVYISTDYVFDGTSPPYSETATPNPLNAYGQSKLEGERVTMAAPGSPGSSVSSGSPASPRTGLVKSSHAVLDMASANLKPGQTSACEHLVLRIPILFGQVEKLDESAVTVLFQTAKDSGVKTKVDDVQKRHPTHARHVAAVCKQVCNHVMGRGARGMDKKAKQLGGILHFSAHECFTKFQMTEVMCQAFGLSSDHLIPDRAPPASGPPPPGTKRPQDARLLCGRLDALGFTRETDFRKEIKEVLEPFL